jgi:hypothetical protein
MADPVWFARRYPVGDTRTAIAPVSRDGWRTMYIFVGCLVLAAGSGAALGATGHWMFAGAAFLAFGVGGTTYFNVMSSMYCDDKHTVAEYKSGAVKQTEGAGEMS